MDWTRIRLSGRPAGNIVQGRSGNGAGQLESADRWSGVGTGSGCSITGFQRRIQGLDDL